jgi:hypothetical protein
MIRQKKFILFILFTCLFFFFTAHLYSAEHQGHNTKKEENPAAQKVVYPAMPAPGKKVPIGDGRYLIYGFDKKPKLGTVIMKVEIFDAAGQKDTSLQVKADSGMPSMRGAHETGDRAFTLSKKGDYLLPINIVMPGDWEIKLTISKDGNPIYVGRYDFDI